MHRLVAPGESPSVAGILMVVVAPRITSLPAPASGRRSRSGTLVGQSPEWSAATDSSSPGKRFPGPWPYPIQGRPSADSTGSRMSPETVVCCLVGSAERGGSNQRIAIEAYAVVKDLFQGGRYWDRTSDLFGVNEARYRCANRPCEGQP